MPDIFKANPQITVSETSSTKPVKEEPLNMPRFQGYSGGIFSSFIYLPKSVRFIAKEPNEKIILLLRRHPLTNLGWLVLTLVLLLAPSLLSIFPLLSFLPENFKFVAILVWYVVTTAYAIESFLDWFFNICIVTDETVFDVDFTNLIYREISEADLEHIQDVTVRMGGVIRTMFNYGDVYIQTAGEIPRIEFEGVPHPDQVAKVLRELCLKEERGRSRK